MSALVAVAPNGAILVVRDESSESQFKIECGLALRAQANAISTASGDNGKRRELRPGTPDARLALNELLTMHKRFAWKVAHKFSRRHQLDVDDVHQEMLRGMAQAAMRFEPIRGIRFLTYSLYWMRAFAGDRAAADYSIVRVTTGAWANDLAARRRGDVDDTRHGHKRRKLRRDVSVSAVRFGRRGATSDDHEGSSLLDKLTDETEAGAVEELYSTHERAALARGRVASALAKLEPKERAVISGRYLIENGSSRTDGHTFDTLSKTLGITRQRVQQIEVIALRKLRAALGDDSVVLELLGRGGEHSRHSQKP